MTPSWKLTIRVVVFSALLGGASGVLTSAITNNYLSEYSYQLSELTEPLRVTQERPRALPASYETALELVEEMALPAVGARYGVDVQAPVDQFVGPAIALTSDGWLLTQGSPELGEMVSVGGETCLIEEMVSDDRVGMVFVRCDVQNLSVVDFGEGYALAPGDQVFVVAGDALTFSRVKAVTYGAESLRSSDVPARRVILETDAFEDGSAVFSIFGEFVGVMMDSMLVPLEHISGSLEQVLRGEEVLVYPSFGASTIDLSRTVGLDHDLGSGAVLAGVQVFGVAATAGLLADDVIISIDGESIGVLYTLDDLIAMRASGEVIRIEFSRAGEKQELEVTLGSLEQ